MLRDFSHIKTHVDAFVHFLQELDLDMIELLLDEHNQYSGLEKGKFIIALSSLIYRLQSKGDTRLKLIADNVKYSKIQGYGRRKVLLEGDISGITLELEIKYRDNRVFNIIDSALVGDDIKYISKRLLLRYFFP